jgi:diadenosine tetraphosphate (Ap4A) HIT family hydrolase
VEDRTFCRIERGAPPADLLSHDDVIAFKDIAPRKHIASVDVLHLHWHVYAGRPLPPLPRV